MALAHQYPNLKLVFSGGASGDDLRTESDIARTLFGSMGMDLSRVTFENRSLNTCENRIYTARLVNPATGQTGHLSRRLWICHELSVHLERLGFECPLLR